MAARVFPARARMIRKARCPQDVSRTPHSRGRTRAAVARGGGAQRARIHHAPEVVHWGPEPASEVSVSARWGAMQVAPEKKKRQTEGAAPEAREWGFNLDLCCLCLASA